MSMTWVWIVVLLVGALGVLAWPLVRNRNASGASREAYDVAIYQDQLKEAEREHERGLLSAEQTEAVKIELHRKLLAAAGPNVSPKEVTGVKANPRLATAIGTLLFLSVGSIAIYSHLGSPSLDNLAYVDRDIEKEQQAQGDRQAVTEMSALIDQLEIKLATDPENVEGWLMLGRSAVSVGQFSRAVKAYEQAVQRKPNSPQILVDYAEAVMFLNEGRVSNDALVALERAHELNAANPKARYYIALGKAQSGDMNAALQEWVDLLAISLPDAPWFQTVRSQIANAAAEIKIDPEKLVPSEEARRIGDDIRSAASQRPQAPGPSREDMEAAGEMTVQDRQKMIKSMVQRLADRLKENPNDRQGWLRLANAYEVLGETEKSANAMRQAKRLPQ